MKSMNKDKLHVIKQEIARVNIEILAISELKWTEMGEFNLDSVAIIPQKEWSSYCQQKSPKCSTWLQSQNDRMISVHFQGKSFNITVIQVYAPIMNVEEAEVEWFYEDLQDLLELTLKKDVLLITGDWNAKVGSNR